MPPAPHHPRHRDRASRYVGWLRRYTGAIIALSAVFTAIAIYLTAFKLPLHADFSHLLPQDAPSVRDLRALEDRISSQDAVLIVVQSDDPTARAAVASELAEVARALPAELVDRVETDDQITRDFLRAHRHLFVPLEDLEEARAALTRARDTIRARIEDAKLDANPLYVDFDDEDDVDPAAAVMSDDDQQKLDDLRARRDDAEQRLNQSGYVSVDGTLQLVVIRTAFSRTNAERGKELMAILERARSTALAAPGRDGVAVGFTAGVAGSVYEHQALVRGIVLSSIITGLLVAIVLAGYFRSVRLLGLLGVTLVAGTTASFGVAALTVGHLNAATAFLGAIIAGNGVNYGILLIARYLEERRQLPPDQAMAAAIHGTLRPTIVASLGASIAYGSLAATSFRGFADFAVIGGVGMLLCWIVSYTLLPALVLRWGHGPVSTSDSWLGGWIAKIFGFRRAGVVCAVTAVVAIAAGVVTYRFIADDPYEYDMKKLRSDGDDANEAHRWMKLSDENFGRGIAGQTVIAADRLDQVAMIVAALRKLDDGVPEADRTIGVIRSILEVMPPEQDAKLEVLEDLRRLIADDAFLELEDDQRAELAALSPPVGLQKITPDRLPEELAGKLREKNGTVGLLVGVRPDVHLDEWDGRDLIRFASAIRRLELPNGETMTTSGAQVIYADIVTTIRSDGPVVVAVASALLILMVLLVVGRNINAVAVLTATGLGALGLVAVCALLGIKVTFLDFVALPITLGLGVDYAINIAHRHHHGDEIDPVETLRTSGAAVFLCSTTTIIGYGSLLVSENLAIQGFGMASLIGEVCCLLTALIVVPAIVSLRKPRRDDGSLSTEVALGEAPAIAR